VTSKKYGLIPANKSDGEITSRVSDAILGFISKVPKSSEVKNKEPAEAARKAAKIAAAKAAAAAGTLALPPGPLGWLTILPEMVAVWKIQAAMVSDLAAYYGKSTAMTQEQMLYCLFKHTASQAVRDLVARVGERAIVKRATLQALESVAQRIGMKVTQRTISKAATRWLPVVGALGVAAYAYYDTAQVAKSAIELFEREIEFEQPKSGVEHFHQAD
jgi:hypothetical protein